MSIDLKTEFHIEYFNADEKHEHTSLLPLLPNAMSRLAIVAGPGRFAQNPPPSPPSPISLCEMIKVFCSVAALALAPPSFHMQNTPPSVECT